MEIPIGARVAVTAGVGRVRWTGVNPTFAPGKWVGVELDKPGGRNDGSVNGDSYFSCPDRHGVFVRPSQVKLLDDAGPSTASSSMPPPPVPITRAQPSTPPRVTSSASARSVAPSPSTSRRPSASASSSSVRPGPTPTPGLTRSAQASRTLTRTVSAASNVSVAASSRTVASPEPVKVLRAPTPSRSTSVTAQTNVPPSAPAPVSTPTPTQIPASASAPAPTPAPAPIDGPTKRELEELRIKLRILEARKTEDQERIKHLESKASENEAMRAARGKLQTKFQDLQTGLVAAQRAAKDLQSENTHLESRLTDLLEQLEMATLDREMAEEKVEMGVADALKMEERVAELEIEVAVLREENAVYDKPPTEGDGERSSIAFIQLEKHNERLKDALIRLRDVSSEAEKEHRSRIAELEKELSSTDDLSSRNELAEAKLANAESQIEDLKLQLDDALGAEDMLEQLTERNMQMGERIEEMRIAIEDLEALKELNDELEEGHVETEKQLAEEVAALETGIREERARSEALAESMLDMEQTITQFRDLVTNLQIELDDVRSKHESHLSSFAENSKESHAVMNLNLKLQSTAVKAQSKTIELELKRLETAQLAEHLRIVQAYLPPAYHESESDSASALLFFQRMAYKANLLVTVISQLHGLPLALHDASAEALVGICELRGKLGHFGALNRRFACILRHASATDWLAFATVLAELGAVNVEKRIDSWLELLRTDDFKEGDCARDLGSLLTQFEHLAETVFDRPQLDLGERQLDLALGFDFDLDNFAAAVGFARQAVKSYASEDDVEIITDDSSLEEGIYTPVQGILDQVRSVKGPSAKLVAILEDLTADSSALAEEMLAPLQELSAAVSNAVDIAVQLAQRIAAHITYIRTAKLPLNLLDIDRFLVEITMDIVGETDTPPWEIISQFVSRLSGDLGHVLPKVKNAEKTGALVKLLNPPPWVSRSEVIKAATAQNPEAERKHLSMSEEIRELMREVKIRDQGLQEAGVKAETLERRLEAMRKQTDAIAELENDVAKSKRQEKVYEDALEQLQAELDSLEAENAELRKRQGAGGTDRSALPALHAQGVPEPAILGSAGLETVQLLDQIESLRSALRYVRSENALLQSKGLYGDFLQLPTLSHQFDARAVSELDSSSPASPTSSESDFTLRTPPSRRSLETESKILFREVAAFQASPKIVNLSNLGAPGKWQSRRKSPEQQAWEWQKQESKLQRKVGSLAERAHEARA